MSYKTHLVAYHASTELDFYTRTYCGLNSDSWSEDFQMVNPLTKDKNKCTCKKCLEAHEKENTSHMPKNNYTNNLIVMLNNLKSNQPLYKDSGLWQIRSDDIEEVLFQQDANESFYEFIIRVYQYQQTQ